MTYKITTSYTEFDLPAHYMSIMTNEYVNEQE